MDTPTEESTSKLIYGIYLSFVFPTGPNEPGWAVIGNNKYSVIDPHGVIRVAWSSHNILSLEGNLVEVVVERLFSTVGDIRVMLQLLRVSDNATSIDKDFLPTRYGLWKTLRNTMIAFLFEFQIVQIVQICQKCFQNHKLYS